VADRLHSPAQADRVPPKRLRDQGSQRLAHTWFGHQTSGCSLVQPAPGCGCGAQRLHTVPTHLNAPSYASAAATARRSTEACRHHLRLRHDALNAAHVLPGTSNHARHQAAGHIHPTGEGVHLSRLTDQQGRQLQRLQLCNHSGQCIHTAPVDSPCGTLPGSPTPQRNLRLAATTRLHPLCHIASFQNTRGLLTHIINVEQSLCCCAAPTAVLAQAIGAPLGALLLKFLPARQLEAIVSVLMVVIMGIMNRSTIKGWAVAAVSWLGPSQAAYTGYRLIRQGKGARLPRSSAVASSASSLSR